MNQDDKLVCPVCEKGRLTLHTYSENYLHNGKVLHINGLEGYLCNTCSADLVYPDQIRRGHTKYLEAAKADDDLRDAN